MGNTKEKKTSKKNSKEKKTELKQYALKKIDALSWVMGKKSFSSREELYDR